MSLSGIYTHLQLQCNNDDNDQLLTSMSNSNLSVSTSTLCHGRYFPILHNSNILCKIDKKFEIPRKDLNLEEVLGEGEFGKVVSARAHNIRGCAGG